MPTRAHPTHAGQNAAPGNNPRGSVARALAAIASILVLALLAAPDAHAGEWVQVSCINPDQSAAPSAGWSSLTAGGGYGSDNSTSCGPGAGAYAILSTDAPVPVGSHETLKYTPPAGSTLDGGLLDLGMYADGYGYEASGTAVAYTPEYAYNGSNVFFQCAHGLTPCAGASNDFTGELELPAHRGGNLYLEAGCGSANDTGSCDEGGSDGAFSLIELWWANLRLSNDATPAASAIAGTLLSGQARGERELLLNATDPDGPGIYNITVQAGGQTLYDATPDSNDGQCTPAGESAGALMFDASQPCKQSESIDLPIGTTALADGEHVLKVTLTDAAGNSSVVYDAPIVTHNAPAEDTAPTIEGSTAAAPASTLTAQHGEWSAPAGAGPIAYAYRWLDCDREGNHCQTIPAAEGSTYTITGDDVGGTVRAALTASDNDGSTTLQSAPSAVIAAPALPATLGASAGAPALSAPVALPNGANASTAAQLHIDAQSRITRTYAKRALTLTGQLTNPAGAPIADATLEINEQAAGASTMALIGNATTAANGTFTAHVPAGASRTIQVGYRAYWSESGYSARASIAETVTAGVQMHASPQRTGPSGTITISGQVAGPIPRDGVLVVLLVHYHGAWEPFRDPHTNAGGRFLVRYQFQGAVGRFPFRAQAPGGQTGFPYASGESQIAAVSTR